jgi:hypothetical protein
MVRGRGRSAVLAERGATSEHQLRGGSHVAANAEGKVNTGYAPLSPSCLIWLEAETMEMLQCGLAASFSFL